MPTILDWNTGGFMSMFAAAARGRRSSLPAIRRWIGTVEQVLRL
ncbi:MAG: hypothetical protein U5R46_10155 [Gammaproteobacteria bacterium]|nr:hypothetical protein [Gammaproteobacteria bacterium]